MLNEWAQRLQVTWHGQRRGPAAQDQAHLPLLRTVSQRTEVFPPERLYRAARWRGGLRDWLNTGWDVSAPSPLVGEPTPSVAAPNGHTTTIVADIRQEFTHALADIDDAQARALRAQIDSARSPRELWHLRSAVYNLVATQHSESQAQTRMARLNRHFPLRTLCAGFWTR